MTRCEHYNVVMPCTCFQPAVMAVCIEEAETQNKLIRYLCEEHAEYLKFLAFKPVIISQRKLPDVPLNIIED